jgi:hypothetical protein
MNHLLSSRPTLCPFSLLAFSSCNCQNEQYYTVKTIFYRKWSQVPGPRPRASDKGNTYRYIARGTYTYRRYIIAPHNLVILSQRSSYTLLILTLQTQWDMVIGTTEHRQPDLEQTKIAMYSISRSAYGLKITT